MKVTVHVTEDDILNGNIGNASDCMMTRALKRAFPTSRITVGLSVFRLDRKLFHLPAKASAAIWKWSQKQKIEPFEFELDLNKHKFYKEAM